MKNQTIDIKAMRIYVTLTAVKFDPTAKTVKENLYRGGGILTLGAQLLIRLLNVSPSPGNFNAIIEHHQLKLYG